MICTPVDYYLLSRMKHHLKGHWFQSSDVTHEPVMVALKKTAVKNLQECL
jgi:hypothetical protein